MGRTFGRAKVGYRGKDSLPPRAEKRDERHPNMESRRVSSVTYGVLQSSNNVASSKCTKAYLSISTDPKEQTAVEVLAKSGWWSDRCGFKTHCTFHSKRFKRFCFVSSVSQEYDTSTSQMQHTTRPLCNLCPLSSASIPLGR